jgi:hypothetical protein
VSLIQHATFVSIFADIVLKVRQPAVNEVQQFKDGGTLISFLYPGQNKDLVDQLIAKKLTAFGKPVDFSVSGFITVFNKGKVLRNGVAISYCSFSVQSSGFNSRLVCHGYVVEKGVLGHVYCHVVFSCQLSSDKCFRLVCHRSLVY